MTTNKYTRQSILKDFGTQGQESLGQAKALVVGAGGLSCPVMQYLVSMGIGEIGIIDHDVVSLSNLHRQILYTVDDIGKFKVDVAVKKLSRLNDEVTFQTYKTMLSQDNAIEIIQNYDVIIDCSDNFATRYIVNDACVILGKPLVFGAVSSYEGQLAVFNHRDKNGEISGNYRDLYPTMPKEGEIQNCSEIGVLGALPGIIGSMQAVEAVKIIANIGQPLTNALMTYNALSQTFFTIKFKKIESNTGPKDIPSFKKYQYGGSCEDALSPLEIDTEGFTQIISQAGFTIVDVRNEDEMPIIQPFLHKKINLSDLPLHFDQLSYGKVIFICQSGVRSLKAAKLATDHFGQDRFFSLKGGVSGNPFIYEKAGVSFRPQSINGNTSNSDNIELVLINLAK